MHNSVRHISSEPRTSGRVKRLYSCPATTGETQPTQPALITWQRLSLNAFFAAAQQEAKSVKHFEINYCTMQASLTFAFLPKKQLRD